MRSKGYESASSIARMAKVTPTAVSGWISRGKVRTFLVGKHVFVEVKSVIEYLGPQAAAVLGIKC
jgi:uncharacterized protein (DUF2384 family)